MISPYASMVISILVLAMLSTRITSFSRQTAIADFRGLRRGISETYVSTSDPPVTAQEPKQDARSLAVNIYVDRDIRHHLNIRQQKSRILLPKNIPCDFGEQNLRNMIEGKFPKLKESQYVIRHSEPNSRRDPVRFADDSELYQVFDAASCNDKIASWQV
jgi:hypothetical protein